MDKVFFDSWGGAHVECAPSHPAAGAFGPGTASRPLTEGELRAAGLFCKCRTALGVAATKFPVLREGDWDTVVVKTIG